jgi:hypothetical protein
MMLADHVILNFYNNVSTAAIFSGIETAFDSTRQSGVLYKLSELGFSTSLIKLIASFLTSRKFKVSLDGGFATPRKTAVGVPQYCTVYT